MRKQIVYFFQNLMRHRMAVSVNEHTEREKDERIAVEEAAAKVERGPAGVEEAAVGVQPGHIAGVEIVGRKEFERTVSSRLRENHASGCLLLADVDRFREINDIYGKDVGNAILWNVAGKLGYCFSDYECIGRQGGDTFALWLPAALPEQTQMLRRQSGVLNDRLMHPTEELPPVSLSVGAAFGEPGDDCRSLRRKAVKALNRVKESGRCGCEVYEDKGKEAGAKR